MPAPQLEYAGATMPAPKFWTPRDPAYPTRGTLQAEFSRVWLNQELMPWQRLVLDVAGEYDPVTGRPRRSMVVVTLQRQGGKSHVCLVKKAERAFTVPNYRGWYTAQTGMDARDQFLKFGEESVNGTPLSRFATTLRGNGHEVMKFPNGSTIRPHPPTEKALHGKQSDDSDIDEGWAFTEEDGNLLLQAIAPTQLTRPMAQTWIWSAGGTAKSTWLAGLVARGRAGDPDICYAEWGIPDDLELDDLQAIAEYHPAYGHTVTVDSIRKLRTQLPDDAGFSRAAGNRWSEIIGGAVPADVWRGGQHHAPIPDDAPVGYGAARALDGSQVAIGAAARVGDLIVCELLEVTSAYGAPATIEDWIGRAGVAIDPTGPSAPLLDACQTHNAKHRRAPITLLDMKSRDAGTAVGTFLDGIAAGGIKVRPHVALDNGIKVAGTRTVGDGGKAWARVQAGAPIVALEAITNAIWALEHAPRQARKPTIQARKAS